jgi:hypothetical protein
MSPTTEEKRKALTTAADMGIRKELRWWGSPGGMLHLFEGMAMGSVGGTSIRTAEEAICGWRPPGGVLESPEPTGYVFDGYERCEECGGPMAERGGPR